MPAFDDKPQVERSPPAAKIIVQSESKGDSTNLFTDNRPEALQQKKAQQAAADSRQAKKQQGLQDMANRSFYIFPTSQLSADQQIIQRAPWNNVAAKFRSDNGLPDIPNSEYKVSATSYERYAPINEIRAPGQVYFKAPRSFAYVNSTDWKKAAVHKTETATLNGGGNEQIKLVGNKGASEVIAFRTPVNGLAVWDGDVADNGTVSSKHPGHTVMNLGQPLPHLDDDDASDSAYFQQSSVHDAQKNGRIPSDEKMLKIVYGWIDLNFSSIKDQNKRDNAGLHHLTLYPEKIPELLEVQKAKDEVEQFDIATAAITEWLDTTFNPRT